jgi:hypothetical protein
MTPGQPSSSSSLTEKKLANFQALQIVEKKLFPSEVERKRSDAKPLHDNKWFDNWVCPICQEKVPIKGRCYGQYYRAKHLKLAHDMKLSQCPLHGRQANTQRAQLRAKQAGNQGLAHELVHIHKFRSKRPVPEANNLALCSVSMPWHHR